MERQINQGDNSIYNETNNISFSMQFNPQHIDKSRIITQGERSVYTEINNILLNSTDHNAILSSLNKVKDKIEENNEDESLLIEKRSLEIQLQKFKSDVEALYHKIKDYETGSERLKQAKALFLEGKIKEAELILDDDDIDREINLVIEAENEAEKRQKNLRQKRLLLAKECLLKANLKQIQYSNDKWYTEAETYFQKSIEIYSYSDNNLQYTAFLAYHNQPNVLDKYLKMLANAKSLVQKGEDITLFKVQILNNIGNIYNNQGNIPDAKTNYETGLKFLTENTEGAKHYTAIIKNALLVIANKEEDLNAGNKLFDELKQLLIELNRENAKGYCGFWPIVLSNYALLLEQKELFQEAENKHIEALNLKKTIHEQFENKDISLAHIALTLDNLAVLYAKMYFHERDDELKKEHFKQAVIYYKDALTQNSILAEKNPLTHLPNKALTLRNYAALYIHSKDVPTAICLYLKSLEILEGLSLAQPQFTAETGRVHVGLSMAYQWLGDKDGANIHAKKAILKLDSYRTLHEYSEEYIHALGILKENGIDN